VFAGPDLPKATYGAAMVPTPDGTGVVMIGGETTGKDLHELKCSSRTCNWMKLNKQLSVGRNRAVAFYVPCLWTLKSWLLLLLQNDAKNK
jgi:hypothetical protein